MDSSTDATITLIEDGRPPTDNARVADLTGRAQALGRPLALDVDERVAYLGRSARERGDALASLQAPDFALPDLAGRVHALSEQRGRKVLLVAYASW
jgi:hypothetical protein